MKITQEEVVERQTVIHIELEEKDLAIYLERGYRKAVNRVNVPGFRKGKAPRIVVERFMGRQSLLNEALDFMLPDVTQRAIAAQELETVGPPQMELLDLEPVTIKATVALTPQVDLGAYRDIRVEEEPVAPIDEAVQKRLHEMLSASASWEPASRPVKLGDRVALSLVGTVDGNNVLDERDTDYVAAEESALPFPGFAQQLEGAQVDEPKEFTLVIPADHDDARLAGKEARFTVTVSDIKERKTPELDDAFAKSVDGDYESLDALRESVRQEIEGAVRKALAERYRQASLDELAEVATVVLPPLLVERQVEHLVERRNRYVERLNMRPDDFIRYTGKTQEEDREEMERNAVEWLTRSYALATLAEHEGLEVSAEEVDEKMQGFEASRDERVEADESRNSDPELLRHSASRALLAEKATERLIAIARGECSGPAAEAQDTAVQSTDCEDGGGVVDGQS